MSNQSKEFQIPLNPSYNFVRVQNIPKDTDEAKVVDFLSHCGEIVQIQVNDVEEANSKEALVEFKTDKAATTAVLLTNAKIGTQEVNILYYFDKYVQGRENSYFKTPENYTFFYELLKDLALKGYEISNEIIERFRQLDEKYELSKTVGEYISSVKTNIQNKAGQVNEEYKLGEKVSNLDERLGVSQKVGQAKQAASTVGAKAMETKENLVNKTGELKEAALNSKPAEMAKGAYEKVAKTKEEAQNE